MGYRIYSLGRPGLNGLTSRDLDDTLSTIDYLEKNNS